MKLITEEQRRQLLANGRASKAANERDDDDYPDHPPVVKLFTPDAQATWLISEMDPYAEGDEDLLFGLCDLGMGFPELGYVRLSELTAVRGRLGLPIERDRFFVAAHPISVYADEARMAQHIVA